MTPHTYLVANLGLRPNEETVLQSICTLSGHPSRNHHFRLAQDSARADLFIVNSEDASAVDRWRNLDPDYRHPVVMIEPQEKPAVERARVLRRPLLASRLLATLDQLAGLLGRRASGSIAQASVARDAAQVSLPARATEKPAKADSRPTQPQASTAAETVKPLAQLLNVRERHSVLVVDDSPTVRKQLELLLRQKKIDTTLVGSANEALAEFEKARFDLVLLDVVLPGTDGYQICKALRKLPNGAGIPVVMLTSKSSPFDRLRGTLAGCDTYLVKPVEIDKFLAVLDKYLTVNRLWVDADSVFVPARS